jgi:hypothetical protein
VISNRAIILILCIVGFVWWSEQFKLMFIVTPIAILAIAGVVLTDKNRKKKE